MDKKEKFERNNASENLIRDIRNILYNARSQTATAINTAMVNAYWKIGERIVLEEQGGKMRAEYGAASLKELSKRLTIELGKGFSPRNLQNYRQFYILFPDWTIWNARVPNLTWTHIRILLRVSDKTAREWYLAEASSQMWSSRTLDRNVSTQYYHRLLASSDPEAVKTEMEHKTSNREYNKLSPAMFLKSPYVTEFLGISQDQKYTERELETALITHLQHFIMELGKGFAFVERQQHIVTETDDYYIDLVFYNYILKCFVLIDLKTNKITHQDVGQMDMYVRMYDDLKRTEGDNPTLGIVLCSETDQDVAKYSVLNGNNQLFASKYLILLPSEQELRQEIEAQKALFYLQHMDDFS
ncbi:MAG: PDDEXK nuclease domain-containing protein [Muribaculaceae bacterium]|nr:PDDEXK nuclease domain-containing protein [Muribaculaceae bacterium]